MRHLILFSLFAFSCGRTPVEHDDAGVNDAGVNEAALFVFTGDNCPDAGTEADLKPQRYDGLAVVKFRALGECSGAEREWFYGVEDRSTSGLFVGAHTCYFHPPALRGTDTTDRFAVVRFSQTAALFHGPTGWCITDANGNEPVTTDAKNLAWGVYATEAGARAAYARLKPSP